MNSIRVSWPLEQHRCGARFASKSNTKFVHKFFASGWTKRNEMNSMNQTRRTVVTNLLFTLLSNIRFYLICAHFLKFSWTEKTKTNKRRIAKHAHSPWVNIWNSVVFSLRSSGKRMLVLILLPQSSTQNGSLHPVPNLNPVSNHFRCLHFARINKTASSVCNSFDRHNYQFLPHLCHRCPMWFCRRFRWHRSTWISFPICRRVSLIKCHKQRHNICISIFDCFNLLDLKHINTVP